MRLRNIVPLSLFLGVIAPSLYPAPPKDSPRITDTVRVVQKTENGVAAVFSQAEGSLSMGSGSIIHPEGFILTNDHVIANRPGVVLLKGHKPLNYRIIGALPEKDLCLLRIDTDAPLTNIKLGRSNDLLTGEPILCAGNPGGRGVVYSRGIVSSPRFMLSAPNALVMYYFSNDTRDRFIQFDAASNGGNSGGPLLNILGEQIGVVARKKLDEENINFAIPIDRVRENLVELFAPEIRKGFETGITIDPLSPKTKINTVTKGSSAAKAGLKPGETIITLDGRPIGGPVDWMAQLLKHKPGDELKLEAKSGHRKRETVLKLAPYKEPVVVVLKDPKPGLHFKLCLGNFVKVPDFETEKVVKWGIARKLDILAMAEPKNDNFAIQLEGYLKIPKDGIYRLILNSDDGSRLYIGKESMIDNDGPHPAQDVGRLLRLRKGFLPVRIDYFEATGDASLGVFIQNGPGERESADKLFFHESESKPNEAPK
jgi:S1-C subfamily serine protease